MADKIDELRIGPVDRPEDLRIALRELVDKINQVVRALNQLIESTD